MGFEKNLHKLRGKHSKTERKKILGRESCLCRDCNQKKKKRHHHRIGRNKKVYKKGKKSQERDI